MWTPELEAHARMMRQRFAPRVRAKRLPCHCGQCQRCQHREYMRQWRMTAETPEPWPEPESVVDWAARNYGPRPPSVAAMWLEIQRGAGCID